MKELYPYSIYDEINKKVEELICVTNEKVENEKIEEAKKETQKILKILQNKLENNIQDLKKNSEWDTFTIAFYGETNAGKSTLIEALRILLNEKTKIEERKKFNEIKKDINNNLEKYEQIEKGIEKKELRLKENENEKIKNNEKLSDYTKSKKDLKNKLNVLKEIKLEYNNKEKKISIEGNSLENVLDLNEVKLEIDEKVLENDTKINKNNTEIKKLKKIVEEKKSKRNLITKIIYLFFNKKEEEEIEIKEKIIILKEQKKEKEKKIIDTLEKYISIKDKNLIFFSESLSKTYKEIRKIGNQNGEIEKEIKKIEIDLQENKKKKEILENELKKLTSELEKYRDGKIIGNGKSDYTRENTEYIFEIENQKFAIIDMPGIEGKENEVINSIMKAVQKAHSVFYITGKATAPQTGDENRKGTLEKIKEQLGAQTEVRTIYNKRITNRMQLSGEIINQDEIESLKTIDEKMKEILKENYIENLVISARVAYLSVANCLPITNEDYKNRKKFFEKFSENELLEFSGILKFIESLSKDMVLDFKTKIKKSNYNKIVYTLRKLINEIDTLQKEKFKKIEEKFEEQIDNSKHKLEIEIDDLASSFNNLRLEISRNFKKKSIDKIYKYIEENRSNSDVKNKLKEILEINQKKIEEEFSKEIEVIMSEFRNNIEKIMKDLKRYLENILSLNYKISQIEDFNIELKIDNGIKWGKILISLMGIVLLWLNPVGLIGTILGIGGIVLGIFDGVVSFFNSEYKISQQKKSVTKNIDKLYKKLNEEIEEKIKELMPEIGNQMKEMEKQMEIPLNQIKKINEKLITTNKELKKLKNEVEEGDL